MGWEGAESSDAADALPLPFDLVVAGWKDTRFRFLLGAASFS